MKEDFESQNFDAVAEEANLKEDTLQEVFRKCVEALEVVEKALGITPGSDDEKAIISQSQNFIESEPEQRFVSNHTSNLPKPECVNTDKITQPKRDFADLKQEALKAQNLTKRSQELKAKSEQSMARSRELKIDYENWRARSRSSIPCY